jgi:hypothetical protein
VFSRLSRSSSACNCTSSGDFAGRPAGWTLSAHTSAPIARCSRLWNRLRDSPSSFAACDTVFSPDSTDRIAVSRGTTSGGTSGNGV